MSETRHVSAVTGTPRRWPLFLIAAPAAVAVWSGWVGLGDLCGFGIVHPLPGIVSGFPAGHRHHAAGRRGGICGLRARRVARSRVVDLGPGADVRAAIGDRVAVPRHARPGDLPPAVRRARTPCAVAGRAAGACLPVVTLGFGAALTHLLRADGQHPGPSGEQASGMSADRPVLLPGLPAQTGPDTAHRHPTGPVRTPSPNRHVVLWRDLFRTQQPHLSGSRRLTGPASAPQTGPPDARAPRTPRKSSPLRSPPGRSRPCTRSATGCTSATTAPKCSASTSPGRHSPRN
jgi:hypothetical protein